MGCTELFCAVKGIFGKEEGIKILWLLVTKQINTSHLAGHAIIGTEYVQPWSNTDLDVLVQTFGHLPNEFDLSNEMRTVSIFREDLDVPLNGLEKIANATMLFGSNWSKQLPRGVKESSLFHDIAHNIADYKKVEEEFPLFEEWLKVSGWQVNHPINVLSEYADTHPAEDLAESITAYRYAPTKLKTTSPGRYQFIKKHIFDNKEFLTAEDCKKWKWEYENVEAAAVSTSRHSTKASQ